MSAKIVWRDVIDANAAHSAAKLDRVSAHLYLGKVTQLPSIAGIDRMTGLGPATDKRAAHIKHRSRVCQRFEAIVIELKARFIDCGGVDDRGLGHLENLRGVGIIVATFRQRKAVDAVVARYVMIVAVA